MSYDKSILNAKANIATATTDGAIVSAVAGKRIAVVAMSLTQGTSVAATTFNTKPAGAGSAISAAFSPAASTSMALPYSEGAWFTTNIGEGLTATTGATTSAVGIQVQYRVVT